MIRVVVVGAGGYGGAELVGLLLAHPDVSIVGLFASERRGSEASAFGDVVPRFREQLALPLRPTRLADVLELEPDVVFLATPATTSHDLAPALVDAGITVLDLSGAFRLPDRELYVDHYDLEHAHVGLLETAVYGLPELNRARLAHADLIAVPGCYPTSIILPLEPLAAAGAVRDGEPVTIDATSGVSGAGRSPSPHTHFCEVSLGPYAVFEHRHAPEIECHAGCAVIFTPHLAPFDRGILSTIHVPLAERWDEQRARDVLAEAYSSETFPRLLAPGTWPTVGAVRGTNHCDIGLAGSERWSRLIIVSAIDNLMKGAAGQAVQCMNVRLGLPEGAGLVWGSACPIG